VKFIDALEAERQGNEGLGVAKTDRIRRRKKGGASTITSADKQATSAIAIHQEAVSSEKTWKVKMRRKTRSTLKMILNSRKRKKTRLLFVKP